MSNRPVTAAEASPRGPSGTSRAVIVTSPARATPGSVNATTRASKSFFIGDPSRNRAARPLRDQGRSPSCEYNPYTVKRLLLALLVVAAAAAPGASAATPRVLAIHYKADVNPVTQDWLSSQLDRAQNDGYDAAAIILDTPGGLSESMRKIVQKELSLRIPVIVYVAPSGARAA